MRGLADAAIRRRQFQFRAHGAIEKGVGLKTRRPDGFVQPRQHQSIGADQARFEQAENLQARMRPRQPAQHALANQRVEKSGVAFGVEGENRIRRLRQFRKQSRERLAVFAAGKQIFFAGDDLPQGFFMRV